MADRGPFVMLFATIADDHRAVWSDRGLLYAYCHCAMAANAVYPASFGIPREVSDDEVEALTADGILDPAGDGRFAFHGLAKLRSETESRGLHGGLIRGRTGQRDDSGRFVPASSGNAGPDAGHTNGTAPADAGRGRWHSTLVTSVTTQEKRKDESVATPHTLESVDSTIARAGKAGASVDPAGSTPPDPAGIGVSRAEVGGGRYGTPNAESCHYPDDHRSEWRYTVGVGWQCLVCDVEKPGAKSFREKARDHGADL